LIDVAKFDSVMLVKSIIRSFLIYVLAIFLVSKYFGGLSYSDNFRVLFISGGVLAIANLIIKPIIKLVSLPLNIITLGIFSWFIDAIILFGVTKFVSGLSVSPFTFNGLSWQGVYIPQVSFNFLMAVIVCSFAISFIFRFFHWLCD